MDMTHYKQQFTDTVRDLAGSPMRSIMREFVDKENKKGSIVYLDSAGAGEDLTHYDLKDKKNRKTYEADESKTLAKWNAIHTPHNDITRQRTISSPKIVEWGHVFDEDEDILELLDPQNKVVRQGMRSVFKAQDKQIIDAIAAASVSRVDGDTSEITPETISFPGGQAFNTAQHAYVSLKDISTIMQKFEDQYVTERVFCLISPTTKKGIIDNNEKVHDTDFVDRHSYFHDGKLPDIYGVHFIPHPLVANNKFFAFTKEAIVCNISKGLESDFDKVPNQRCGYQAYVREKSDTKRVDDLQVTHGTITTG